MNDINREPEADSASPPGGAPSRLAEALMKMMARESGGMVGADRYDYQKDWALCKIMELHAKGTNYVVLCEFHEDITVLDDADAPSRVTFYQIKTDEKKNWTIRRLIARKKGAGNDILPSILGNLCGKSAALAGCHAEFRFASNAKFSIKSATGTPLDESESFLCVEIDAVDRETLKAALTTELQSPLPSTFEQVLGFEVADLALLSHADATTGKLAKFLDDYAKGCAVPAAPFYRALFDEVRRRTVAKRPKTALGDVCSAKGVSRAQFDEMLRDAMRATPVDRTVALIQQDLIAAATPLGERIVLLEAVSRYYVRRLNPNDTALHRFRRQAVNAALSIMESKPDVTLPALAQETLMALWPSAEIQVTGLSPLEVKALVMVELYERRESEVPTAGTKSPKAQP